MLLPVSTTPTLPSVKVTPHAPAVTHPVSLFFPTSKVPRPPAATRGWLPRLGASGTLPVTPLEAGSLLHPTSSGK